MSVSNGQQANETTFNEAFASKTADNELVGNQNLNDPDAASGTNITNAQRQHNSIASYVGALVNQLSTYLPTWATNNVGTSGDSLFARIAALDVFAGTKGVADGIAPLDSSAKVPLANLPDSVTGAREFKGNWSAATNTPTLADGDVETAGSEYNVTDDGTVDFGSGNITFTNGDTVIYNGSIWSKIDGSVVRDLNDIRDVVETSTSDRDILRNDGTDWRNFNPDQIGDDTATGSNATLSAPGDLAVVRLTDNSLASVDGVPDPGYAQRFILVNATGTQITINNETGATAAERILTGSGQDLELADDGVVILVYDTTDSRWRITGGSGGGGANVTLSNLNSPTAINQDLIFDKSNPFLKSKDETGATTDNLNVQSGDVSGAGAANSGNLNIKSGNANGASQFSGNVQITSGTGGSFGSGGLTLSTGASSGGSGGGISANTGNNSGGSSGNVAFTIGTASTTQGNFKFLKSGVNPNIGDVFTATATDGSGYWSAPSGSNGVSIVNGADSTFEVDDISWSTYADTAQSNPEDGDGGSANITVTRTTTPSEVVRGTASLKISKDASNRQGEGAVLFKSVDKAFRGKSIRVSFNYEASAAFDFGTISTDSDVTVWAYDVTNSKLLNLNFNRLTGEGRFESDIFIPSDCEEIRFILHVATTNASAWDLFIDDFIPELVPFTSFNNMSDWAESSSAITIGATTSAPTKGTVTRDRMQYRQVGDEIYVRYDYGHTTAGTAGSGDYIYELPPEAPDIDSNWCGFNTGSLGSTADQQDITVNGTLYLIGVGNCDIQAIPYSSRSFRLIGDQRGVAAAAAVGSAFFSLGAANHEFSLTIKYKAVGLTSGAKTPASIGLNAKQVLNVYKNGGTTTSLVAIPTWTGKLADSLDEFDLTTGVITIKKPGSRWVSFHIATTITGPYSAYVYLNGSAYYRGVEGESSGAGNSGVSVLMPNLNYGDQIDFRVNTTRSVIADNTSTYVSMFDVDSVNQPYAPRTAFFKEIQASASGPANSPVAGTWTKRLMNTLSGDQSFISSSAAGDFDLEPGTYRIKGRFPQSANGSNPPGAGQVRLYNVTLASTEFVGSSINTQANGASANIMQEDSVLNDEIVVDSVTSFRVEHWVASSGGTFGNIANNGENNIYGELEITKIL